MIVISKKMPGKPNTADGGSSFALGRKSFFNKTYDSHLIDNLSKNNSSKINPKPISDNSSVLRTQRLRLNTIGSGSSKLKDNNDSITFFSTDKNLVNTLLNKTRF